VTAVQCITEIKTCSLALRHESQPTLVRYFIGLAPGKIFYKTFYSRNYFLHVVKLVCMSPSVTSIRV
jgi:hypothetical protein